MTGPVEAARTRVAQFLAAHTDSGKSDELAICDYRDGSGYAVAVLRADDLRDALTEMGGRTEPIPDGQAALLAVLLDALEGVPISDAERLTLRWLAGTGADTVENIAAIIRRSRVVRW